MASSQAKIGCKMMRQRENENYRSVSSLPATKYTIPKKQQKKLKKIKKYHYGFFSIQNMQEKAKKERK